VSPLKKRLLPMVLAGLFVCSFTAALDFCRMAGKIEIYNAFPAEYIKRLVVLLAASLVWLAGPDSIRPGDNRLMKLVFVPIVIGEIFFLQGLPLEAIASFALCQLLLIKRHSRGLMIGLKKAAPLQRLLLALSGTLLLLALLWAFLFIGGRNRSSGLLIGGSVYGLLLCFSLWCGFANFVLGLFPAKNAGMIAAGMLCFFCCDICVALDGLLQHGFDWLLARSLIWIFYGPALFLLALSAYSFKKT
jgi:hypothetical protein